MGKVMLVLCVAHLFLLYASLQCFYVVLNSHVDESVLRLGLHHPRALRTNHLDRLWHVDVAVHPCSRRTYHTEYRVGNINIELIWIYNGQVFEHKRGIWLLTL